MDLHSKRLELSGYRRLGGFFACLSLLGFWRVHGLSTREPGPHRTHGFHGVRLGYQERFWGRRSVTILLSDVRAAADPFMVAPEPEGGWWKQPAAGSKET